MNFFFEERKKQIRNQIKIDNLLKNLNEECSKEVSEYLLFQREFTREQQLKVINSSIFEIKKEISKQLELTNHFENIFFNTLSSFPTCEKLKTVIFLSTKNKNV